MSRCAAVRAHYDSGCSNLPDIQSDFTMLLCHIQRSASGARQRSRVPSLSHSPFLAEPLLPIRQIYTEMTLLHVKTMTSQFFLISSRLSLSWQAAPRAHLTNEIEGTFSVTIFRVRQMTLRIYPILLSGLLPLVSIRTSLSWLNPFCPFSMSTRKAYFARPTVRSTCESWRMTATQRRLTSPMLRLLVGKRAGGTG